VYGGGFATVPAYLADIFGTRYVGAIHGRLLTAWSTAGIIGPVIVNYLHDMRLAASVPRDRIYGEIFYVLAALLALGFPCNALIRPVHAKWHMTVDAGKTVAGRAAGFERAAAELAGAVSTPRPSWPGRRSEFRFPGASGRRSKMRQKYFSEGALVRTAPSLRR
jgi:hypothetical protein